MADKDPIEKTESQLKALSEALETGTMQHARRMLNELRPAEIADLLESLPYTERNLLWDLVDPEKEGEVLLEVDDHELRALEVRVVDHAVPVRVVVVRAEPAGHRVTGDGGNGRPVTAVTVDQLGCEMLRVGGTPPVSEGEDLTALTKRSDENPPRLEDSRRLLVEEAALQPESLFDTGQ